MDTSLKEKIIVITGASSGAGRAAAMEFALHGAAVVLAARNENALNELAGECNSLGAETLVVVTDVADPKAMINLANAANDWKGRIDVWINNAGVLAGGTFDHTPMEVHTQVVQTNLLGYMNGAHAVLPIFKAQGYGTLINNISVGGFMPLPYSAGYTASKFGLRGFSEALKGELSEWRNIRVCDLFPAFLDTPGINHAANYTGKVLKPAPPVYDPKRVAEAMVKVALRPAANTYIGITSPLLKIAHGAFPELTTKFTTAFLRRYLKNADEMSLTNGNLFNTVDFGMSTNGHSGLKPRPAKGIRYAGALLVGALAGFYLVR